MLAAPPGSLWRGARRGRWKPRESVPQVPLCNPPAGALRGWGGGREAGPRAGPAGLGGALSPLPSAPFVVGTGSRWEQQVVERWTREQEGWKESWLSNVTEHLHHLGSYSNTDSRAPPPQSHYVGSGAFHRAIRWELREARHLWLWHFLSSQGALPHAWPTCRFYKPHFKDGKTQGTAAMGTDLSNAPQLVDGRAQI